MSPAGPEMCGERWQPDDLRQRLLDMRASLVAGLGEQIDGGYLSMIAGVNAALEALDVAENSSVTSNAAGMARVVIVDDPDAALRLVYHGAEGRAVAAPVSPIYALVLAGKLIEAATRRLA